MSNKTYFLFGKDAIDALSEGIEDEETELTIYGTDAVIYGDENDLFSYDTFVFIDGETHPTTLLNKFAGWEDWATISKEEYDEI